jgi:folate-binding protein YgfZ
MAPPLSDALWSWRPAGPARIDRPVGLLRLDGPDSLRFLHGQTSQDLQQAQAGQWLGTCCITPTGRLRAVAEVLVDADGAWLVIGDGEAATVRDALDRVLFPADDVRLGPLLPGLWSEPVGDPAGLPEPTAPGRWETTPEGDGWQLGEAVVRRLPQPPGTDKLPAWLARRPALTPAQAERWRLRLGRPAAPGEIQGDTNPFELGLTPRVSLAKGCYVGQETLAKLATYDGVKQQLRRWSAAAGASAATALAPGASLRSTTGERAGTITSALQLPDDAHWIGLALVRRQALDAADLVVGEGAEAIRLELTRPEAFVPAPVGAGGGGR